MEFDYSRLIGRIKDRCKTQEEFAKRIKMGRVSINKRLNNKLDFDASEIQAACEVLDIPKEEIPDYFFTRKVQKTEQIA